RAILDAFGRYINADGLIEAPYGWNFTDWVPSWDIGTPPGAQHSVSSIINFQMVMMLRKAAELESFFDEPELAARARRLADAMAAATVERFWDASRGLFADDLEHAHFSEHAQCMALLSG